MKIETYQVAAKRTCKDLGEVYNIAHMALGMASELSELHVCLAKNTMEEIDRVNLAEELGDKMWYAANYATFRGINLGVLAMEVPVEVKPYAGQIMGDLVLNGGKLADYAKRWLAYGQPIDQQKDAVNEGFVLMEYINSVRAMCEFFDINFEEVLGRNITKLYVRYPEKFSEDQALVRDLEAERLVLEGKE